MRIAIGSLNPVKNQAAAAVLRLLYPAAEFVAVDAPSGVSRQPWSEEETRQGALNRARAALEQTHADLGIGLEGGLMRVDSAVMICAWAAVIAADGRQGLGGGAHLQLPLSLAARLNPGQELGPLMDELVGEQDTRQNVGAIGILTDGLETRQSSFEHLLRLALAPFRRPDLYRSDEERLASDE